MNSDECMEKLSNDMLFSIFTFFFCKWIRKQRTIKLYDRIIKSLSYFVKNDSTTKCRSIQKNKKKMGKHENCPNKFNVESKKLIKRNKFS